MYRDQKRYEEYAYILDYLPHGRPGSPRSAHSVTGVIQLVGESYFTLLEAAPKPDAEYNIRDRIYVGKGDRARVGQILGRIGYNELTSSAKLELPSIVEVIVESSEPEFVNFFNSSQQVTPRMHSMELIPGIGKRLMRQILSQRDRAPFIDFDDLKERISLSDPMKLISRRVMQELSEEQKYYLFTRPI